MNPCAYCGQFKPATKEHVIPRWFHTLANGELVTFNARQPLDHLKGELFIRDVCKLCNNGILAKLDSYGMELYQRYWCQPVFPGQTIEFNYDGDQLIRWLLKICYNSSRVHKNDEGILSQYKEYILGTANCPGKIAVFLHLVTPSIRHGSQYRQATLQDRADDCLVPRWFRLVQFRGESWPIAYVVQRQIAIHGFWFTIIATSPEKTQYFEDAAKQFRDTELMSVELHSGQNSASLCPSEEHMVESMIRHMSGYRFRYDASYSEGDEKKQFRDLLYKPDSMLYFELTSEEILGKDASETCDTFRQILSDFEVARGLVQKIVLFTSAYDEDSRELWQIPEVIHYAEQLVQNCPGLFLLLDREGKSLRWLLMCFCYPAQFGNDRRLFAQRFKDFMNFGFEGLNLHSYRLAIGEDQLKRISLEINDIVSDVFGING
jgi:hypothetical protein